MDEKEFLELVSAILEVDADTVHLSDDLEELGWDSLSNIGFIAEVDTRTGLTIEADDLTKAKTVADLQRLVQDAAGA